MAKRAKNTQAKNKRAKKTKAAKKSAKRTVRASKRRTSARKTSASKTTARSKAVAKRKKRSPRRTEAEMSWPEVRAARRRSGARRFEKIVRDFERTVNMTPQALGKWLKTKQSREAGPARNRQPGEPQGHWAGRRIIEIQKKKPADYTRADYSHMRKVIAFVGRRSMKRRNGNLRDSPWRHALMNWGHDPLKGR